MNFYPAYVKDLLTLCSAVYSLTGTDIYCHCVDLLPLLMVFTLLSILSVRLGTLLPENIRTESTLAGFNV